jgi:hypothetical protein
VGRKDKYAATEADLSMLCHCVMTLQDIRLGYRMVVERLFNQSKRKEERLLKGRL